MARARAADLLRGVVTGARDARRLPHQPHDDAADPDFILSVLTCGQYGFWNDSGYCNPAYDKLYTKQKSTTDPQERQKIVYQMQEMAYNDRPYIILSYDERLDAWSKDWDGFMESSQGFFNNFSTQSLTSVHQVA